MIVDCEYRETFRIRLYLPMEMIYVLFPQSVLIIHYRHDPRSVFLLTTPSAFFLIYLYITKIGCYFSIYLVES